MWVMQDDKEEGSPKASDETVKAEDGMKGEGDIEGEGDTKEGEAEADKDEAKLDSGPKQKAPLTTIT